MIIIGDVHGCYKTLMELIKQFPKNEKICFVGDVIDRGPRSKEVLDFIINNNYDCVMGNHEEAMVINPSFWIKIGGISTVNSIGDPKEIEKYREIIKRFPDYIIYENCPNISGRKLLICHAGLTYESLEQCVISDHIRWRQKKQPIIDHKEYFQVFGHLVNHEPEITDYYANIDTGCCFSDKKKLTALQFPEMKIYQHENID